MTTGVVHCEWLEVRLLPSGLTISIDYSFDTNDFFDTQEKRDLLQEVADLYSARITDDLTDITPFGDNTWKAVFTHPATGQTAKVTNLVVPEGTIIVYAGGRDLKGGTLAIGGPGGYSALGSDDWFATVDHRGQTGAANKHPTDFGPWGGSITFDSIGTDWFFGSTTTDLNDNQSDFMSVAMHELGHMFGFGTAESFDALIFNGAFTGAKATAVYDGPGSPPLARDHSHWADELTDNGEEVAMDPTIADGTRKLFTDLDWAALDDLGWTLTNATPLATPVISLPSPEPTYFRGGARINLDPLATFDNPDGVGLKGSKLQVILTGNAGKFDSITIATGNGIKKSGSTIKFNGVTIGTSTNGTGTKPFTLNFKSTATDAAVQACLRNLQFSTTSRKAGTLDRTFSIRLVNLVDQNSVPVTRVVHVK